MYLANIRAIVAIGCLLAAQSAAALDLAEPRDALTALRKIHCSLKDGEPHTYWWHGRAYSRVPGEADRLLFLVEGMNIRQCGPLENAAGPADFRLAGREILLYMDPATGEVLRTWKNPWTGKEVEVLHVANDPVNGNFSEIGRGGQPFVPDFTTQGGQWWLTMTVPLFYRNVLGGDYQEYVGGTYHAAELFNFFGDVKELTSRRTRSVATRVGWVRMSKWLPWMEMGDRPGMVWFHTAGRKLDSHDEMSANMKAEIAANYPEYNEPPPLDDKRRNETSWTYFKKHIDKQKQ